MFEGVYYLFAIFVAAIPFVIVGGILYLVIQRKKEHGDEIDWVSQYFQIASFLLLILVWWGLADMGRLFIERAVGAQPEYTKSRSYYYDEYYEGGFKSHPSDTERFARRLSVRISAFLVALPLFLYHYTQARRRGVHKLYYAVISLFSGGVFVIALVLLVRVVVEAMVGLAMDKSLFSKSLPYLAVTGVIWIYHLRQFQQNRKIKASEPVPVLSD